MGAIAGLRHLQTNRDSRPIEGMEGKPIHFSVSVRFAGAIVVAEERKTWKITKYPPPQQKSLNFCTTFIQIYNSYGDVIKLQLRLKRIFILGDGWVRSASYS